MTCELGSLLSLKYSVRIASLRAMRAIHYLRSRETQVVGGYSNGTRLLSPWPDRSEGLQLISHTLFRLGDLESILQESFPLA